MSAVVLSCLALAACGGDEVAGTTDTPDSSTPTDAAADSFVSFETTVAPTDVGGDTSTVEDSAVTTTVTDTSVPPDTTTGCNTFGCQCEGNGDCLDGFCIEGVDGKVCTRTCIESCPDGFECVQTLTTGDPVSLCVPQFTRLCRPCEVDGDCQAGNDPYPAYCITDDDPRNGSFCAASCASRDCPEGYSCADVTTQGGAPARQCVPTSGECTCRPSWVGLGFTTDCKVVNAFGACDGSRTCAASGLTACIGEQASPELCDGEDNDCNGQTDDIPAVPCLVTNQFGSCSGTTACGIGSTTCVGPEAGPETCDGQDDNCNGATDEGSCDDGLGCTSDTCKNGSDCEHVLNGGQCLINGACWSLAAFNPLNACEQCDPSRSTLTWSQTPNTCVIGGACYPSAAVNPQNACQICNPNQTTSAWTTAANTCTIGGQCYLANDPNPQNACEICVPATSTTTWTQASNTCNIQGQCFAAGVKKPGEACFVCDPTRSASGWSAAAANTSCDDASPCSNDDHCDGAGACVGNKSCNDGISCTQDTCTAGGCDNTQVASGQCRINGTCWNQQNQNPANQCQWCSPATSATAWSNKPTTELCSDGNACTLNDFCSGGGCTAGTPKSCNDGNTCTSDGCNTTTGACTTNNIGGGCDDGNSCTNADTCGGGQCTGSPQLDDQEPNNTSATAKNLGNFNDTMDYGAPDGPTLTKTLYGVGDIDWYRYHVHDAIGGLSYPRVQLTVPAGYNYDVCMYLRCDDGTADAVACADGNSTDNDTVPGYEGCCSTKSGNQSEDIYYNTNAEFDCDDGDDDYTILVVVKNAGANWTCGSSYTLTYGDD